MMRPYDVKTERQLLDLTSDNRNTKHAWILLGVNHVTVCVQQSGGPPIGQASMSRRDFNRLIDWYMKDQKARKRVKPRPTTR